MLSLRLAAHNQKYSVIYYIPSQLMALLIHTIIVKLYKFFTFKIQLNLQCLENVLNICESHELIINSSTINPIASMKTRNIHFG